MFPVILSFCSFVWFLFILLFYFIFWFRLQLFKGNHTIYIYTNIHLCSYIYIHTCMYQIGKSYTLGLNFAATPLVTRKKNVKKSSVYSDFPPRGISTRVPDKAVVPISSLLISQKSRSTFTLKGHHSRGSPSHRSPLKFPSFS